MTSSQEKAFIALYSIGMILIVTTNLTVLCFVIYKSMSKSSKNILVISLCVADLGVGVFVIPNVILITTSATEWVPLLCKMCLYTEFVATYASAVTMTFIAIDRFRAIICPIKFKQTKGVVPYIMVAFIWISAIVYSLRAMLLYDVVDVEVSRNNFTMISKVCTVPLHMREYHNALVIVDFIILFGIPGIVLLFTNIAVSIYLRKQTLSNSDIIFQKRQKAIRILIAMVAIFIICHLPLYVIRLYMLTHRVENGMILMRSFLLLTFLNSFINVFFYSSLSDDVKKLRNMLLKKTFCIKLQGVSSSVHPIQTSVNTDKT